MQGFLVHTATLPNPMPINQRKALTLTAHVHNLVSIGTSPMKKNLLLLALNVLVASASFAQTPAPAGTVPAPASPTAAPAVVKAAPAVPAPAAPTVAAKSTIHAVCKDGSAFDGDSMKGACSGHGGVDKKATKASNSSPAAAAKAAPGVATNANSATKPPANAPMGQAPGGGVGKVWANDSTKVYHCANDRYYGKTKRGEYMSEADAKSKGFHADHGKACAA